MRYRARRRITALILATGIVCTACSVRAPVGFEPLEAGADAGVFDATSDVAADQATPPEDGPALDTAIPRPEAGDGPAESASLETGIPAETGVLETGPSDTGTDVAAGDGSNCSVGPGADYQASCTGCSVSDTCLLTCTSCTTDAQTQNANPSLQLPCSGTESVQNFNGVLTCN